MCSNCSGDYEDPEMTNPEPEHGDDGTRQHECANFEGTVVACLCGARFADRGELTDHITDALGKDAMQNVLELAWARYRAPSTASLIQQPTFSGGLLRLGAAMERIKETL